MPSPGNPQSLNRYAYAANNPLRYTDPTGMFTDDAIQAYLKSTYGDAWEQYWLIWSGDQPWLDLLHAAQGGDILSRAMWSNGSLSLAHFVLAGSGHNVLSGVYKAENLTSEPQLQDPERVPLQGVYLNQGAGLSVLHFAENGAVNIAGQMGEIGVSLRAVSRDDVRAQGIFQWLLIFTVSKLNPLIGAGAGLSKALLGPEIGDLPGMKEGDTHLSMGLSVDLGSVTHMSFYETFFRKGFNLGRNGLFDGITTLDRPKTQIRPF